MQELIKKQESKCALCVLCTVMIILLARLYLCNKKKWSHTKQLLVFKLIKINLNVF